DSPFAKNAKDGAPSTRLWEILSLAWQRDRPLLGFGLDAIFLEGLLQGSGNLVGMAGFDLAALDHVNQFSIAQQANRWRRGWISSEVAAGCVGCFSILPGKDGNHAIWTNTMLKSGPDSGAHSSCSASTDGVHHHHR